MGSHKFHLKSEFKRLYEIIRSLDQKVIIIFISVAILQTISWYYTSRRFFRMNFFPDLQFEPNVYLIEYFYWFVGDFFTFFVLPVLIIKIILKEKVKNYGLVFGDYRAGLKITGIFLLIMLPLVWFASSQSGFSELYPQLKSARESWETFLIFEIGLLVYMFAWEFIWRGFMLFGLEKRFGYYSVLIQMIPFLILHNGKPQLETFGAIIGGIALGILALRTRSIFYCVIIHAGVMFSIDLISSLRFRADDYGIGFSSLMSIIKQIL